jgi:hypothetical protein
MAFKMKGSPFQRNFGVGTSPTKAKSPAKDYDTDAGPHTHPHDDLPDDVKRKAGDSPSPAQMVEESPLPQKRKVRRANRAAEKSNEATAAANAYLKEHGEKQEDGSYKLSGEHVKKYNKLKKKADKKKGKADKRRQKAIDAGATESPTPMYGKKSPTEMYGKKKSPTPQKKQVEDYKKEVQELKELIANLAEPGTMAADSTGGSFTPKNLKKVQKKQQKVEKKKKKAIKKGAVEKKD